MTTKHTHTSRVPAQSGSREWILRAGRGVRAAMRDAAAADRRMTDIRMSRTQVGPF